MNIAQVDNHYGIIIKAKYPKQAPQGQSVQ